MIEEEIKGTPMEAMMLRAERLRHFKTTEGYKELIKIVKEQEAALMSAFLNDGEVDINELRAEFRAWHSIVQVIDEPITSYDNWLIETMKQKDIQEQRFMQGVNNGR